MPIDRSNAPDMLRSQGTAAAIGAALLLYFGFAHLDFSSGAGLFEVSANIFVYTLRIGGVALAGVAFALWARWPLALLLDGLICLPIGALLILTGVGMMAGGGNFTQTIINMFCGATFVSAGRHALVLHRELSLGCTKHPGSDSDPSYDSDPLSGISQPTEPPSHAGPRFQNGDPARPTDPPPLPPPLPADESGYLASFARKGIDRDDPLRPRP